MRFGRPLSIAGKCVAGLLLVGLLALPAAWLVSFLPRGLTVADETAAKRLADTPPPAVQAPRPPIRLASLPWKHRTDALEPAVVSLAPMPYLRAPSDIQPAQLPVAGICWRPAEIRPISGVPMAVAPWSRRMERSVAAVVNLAPSAFVRDVTNIEVVEMSPAGVPWARDWRISPPLGLTFAAVPWAKQSGRAETAAIEVAAVPWARSEQTARSSVAVAGLPWSNDRDRAANASVSLAGVPWTSLSTRATTAPAFLSELPTIPEK